jgi:hypothetical protein
MAHCCWLPPIGLMAHSLPQPPPMRWLVALLWLPLVAPPLVKAGLRLRLARRFRLGFGQQVQRWQLMEQHQFPVPSTLRRLLAGPQYCLARQYRMRASPEPRLEMRLRQRLQ